MSAVPDTTAADDLVLLDPLPEPTSLLRRPGARTVAIVVAVLVVTELVARVLSGGLPNPDWNFAQTDRKVGEMEAMAAAGETADVVLIGNSSVNAAFVTDDLEARSGLGTFFNAGLDGSSMRQTEDWTLNVVVPLIAPDTVVIGLTSRDLNDASSSNAEVFDKYLNSRGRARFLGEETTGQQVQRAASRASALVRISPFLRDPASLVTQYNPDGPDTGEFVLPGEEYNPRPLDVTRTRERALNDYTLGGVELDALTRLIEQLASQDIQVVVVEMPFVAEDYLDMHPNGVADYDAYRRVVTDFTSENDLTYVDLTEYPWTTDEFYDFLHVNSTGIAIVNAMVADALVEAVG
ncbi:MAG: SGNH/GDSL hydrolase family protein [Acidimicrobiia bacterium]|nr:hypothetical protein [Acidimicrobiia bacterium]NNF87109.1 SGNH/GDSL hydrolase family protein [Acidimicrobiia bacterium]